MQPWSIIFSFLSLAQDTGHREVACREAEGKSFTLPPILDFPNWELPAVLSQFWVCSVNTFCDFKSNIEKTEDIDVFFRLPGANRHHDTRLCLFMFFRVSTGVWCLGSARSVCATRLVDTLCAPVADGRPSCLFATHTVSVLARTQQVGRAGKDFTRTDDLGVRAMLAVSGLLGCLASSRQMRRYFVKQLFQQFRLLFCCKPDQEALDQLDIGNQRGQAQCDHGISRSSAGNGKLAHTAMHVLFLHDQDARAPSWPIVVYGTDPPFDRGYSFSTSHFLITRTTSSNLLPPAVTRWRFCLSHLLCSMMASLCLPTDGFSSCRVLARSWSQQETCCHYWLSCGINCSMFIVEALRALQHKRSHQQWGQARQLLRPRKRWQKL